MENIFVSYDLTIKLKKIGFELNGGFMEYAKNIETGEIFLRPEYNEFQPDGFNKTICIAPIYSQVIDWFREKNKIGIEVSPFPVYNNQYGTRITRFSNVGGWNPLQGKTYYEALNKAIEEAIKLIEKQK